MSPALPVNLFPHQQQAVQWMRRAEQRPRLVPEQPHGGILAHAMGLGKTMTMLCLILEQGLKSTIVVCPKSVLHQWRDEAQRVLRCADHDIVLYHGMQRQAALAASNSKHRLVLTTFDIVRLDCKASESGLSQLHQEHWDRVVLDEAHRICEQSSKTAKAIRMLRAKNRWCITGTPFKNGVTDLVALSKFLMVPPYCNSTWWRCHSQNKHKMREWRNSFLNMQDKGVLQLPAIVEHVKYAAKLPVEEEVNQCLQALVPLAEFETVVEKQQEHELLKIMRLRQAANHPLMLTNSAAAMTHLITSRNLDSGCADTCAACRQNPRAEITPLQVQVGGGAASTGEPAAKKARRANDTDLCIKHVICAACRHDVFMCPCCIAEQLPVTHNDAGEVWRHSGKTAALAAYLTTTWQRDPDAKVVLFSQWTTCLDMLAHMLDFLRVRYARFDGRVNSIDERGDVIKEFRDAPHCKVLLTSLGAGGEGLNLIFANHVVLMEPYWNCAVEQQAIDRLHRIGQQRVTHVLRLLSANSIEDWVQKIQQKKTTELQRLLCGKDGLAEVMNCKATFRVAPQAVVVGSGLSQFLA